MKKFCFSRQLVLWSPEQYCPIWIMLLTLQSFTKVKEQYYRKLALLRNLRANWVSKNKYGCVFLSVFFKYYMNLNGLFFEECIIFLLQDILTVDFQEHLVAMDHRIISVMITVIHQKALCRVEQCFQTDEKRAWHKYLLTRQCQTEKRKGRG